jgi:Xaa-Pro dipeptidase
MPQATEGSETLYRARVAKVQEAMKEFGLQAVILEPGTALTYLTGVRWGRSERSFVLVLPQEGEPAFVLPGFEEMRARELVHAGNEIRIWQEDESPFQKMTEVLRDRGVTTGRVGIDDAARFFVFNGLRKLAPKLEYVSARPVLKAAGVDTTQTPRQRK